MKIKTYGLFVILSCNKAELLCIRRKQATFMQRKVIEKGLDYRFFRHLLLRPYSLRRSYVYMHIGYVTYINKT